MSDKSTIKKIEEQILYIISQETRPIPDYVLARKVIKNKPDRSYLSNDDIADAINNLIDSGKLKILQKSGYLVSNNFSRTVEVDTSKTLVGEIKLNAKKSGFVTVIENDEKLTYFVATSNLKGALDGDSVEINLSTKENFKGSKEAVVKSVLTRGKDYYVCLFSLNSDGSYDLIPDEQRMYQKIILDDVVGIVNGQKLLIKIKSFENDVAYGAISRVIGHKDDVGTDILSIVYDNGVQPEFTDEVLSASRALTLEINERQKMLRKDLTNLPIITIDPSTSKDFDDAICVEKLANGDFKLIVSIADVAHYVQLNSILDITAIERGCSIYLVDRVIPMLPHYLSDELCSLNYNVERLTTTCEIIFSSQGLPKSVNVYPSIIKSKRRFSYDEVNEFFTNKSNLDNDTLEIKSLLNQARELHKILSKVKKQRGYINFNIPESEIVLNKTTGEIDEIRRRATGEAQQMIENFMLAANEGVTNFCHDHKVPFIYRVHDVPNAEKIKSLSSQTKKLGFIINTDFKKIKPLHISQWLADNKDNPNLDLINILLLRTMAKAEYTINNVGHFGLALENYTHYTSPIRRYPDLMVGRLLWMYVFDRESYSDVQRESFKHKLEHNCSLSSKNELVAVRTERAVNSMKFAEYMSHHLGEIFDGFVSGVTSFGIFVELPNTIEGLIKLTSMRDDFYTFHEESRELIGKSKGLRFSLGTKVKIKVISAIKETGKIEFELTEFLGNR